MFFRPRVIKYKPHCGWKPGNEQRNHLKTTSHKCQTDSKRLAMAEYNLLHKLFIHMNLNLGHFYCKLFPNEGLVI